MAELERKSHTGPCEESPIHTEAKIILDNKSTKDQLNQKLRQSLSDPQGYPHHKITQLESENHNLHEQLTTVIEQNTQNHKLIEQLRSQLSEFRNIKKYADFNKSAARRLIGIENELNSLREKNTDLIHHNFCLTFEKNELYNLIKVLENKIQNRNRDIERLKTMQTEVKTEQVKVAEEKSSCVLGTKNTGFESEKANLIRQVEFYKNKLFLTESNLMKRDQEVGNLKLKVTELTGKMEADQLDFQEKYNEITKHHQTKINEMNESWKKDYSSLEFTKKLKENVLLTLQEKYSNLENRFLESQKEKRELDDLKSKYETLRIKYDTEKLALLKQQQDKVDVTQKDLQSLKDELKKTQDGKIFLEEKLVKVESILNLETQKTIHLREKCRDYWTLLTLKDDQLKIAQKTVETQIVERQQLLKQIEFYKITNCVQNGDLVVNEPPSHDYTEPKIGIEQLYKSETFRSCQSLTKQKSTNLSNVCCVKKSKPFLEQPPPVKQSGTKLACSKINLVLSSQVSDEINSGVNGHTCKGMNFGKKYLRKWGKK